MILRILVISNTKKHKVSRKLDPEGHDKVDAEAGRWREGEPVTLCEAKANEPVGGLPGKFWHIYITDWLGTIDQARVEFLRIHQDEKADGEPVPLTLKARRRFVFHKQLMPRPEQQRLERQRYIELKTAQFIAYSKERQQNNREFKT